MEKTRWPLLVPRSADPRVSVRLREAIKKGELREIAPRLYSSDLTTPLADLVRANWIQIVQYLYPGATVSHRSQLEARPFVEGKRDSSTPHHLFLTYKYTKKINLTGLTIHLLEGPAPLATDIPFEDGRLFFASEARGLLENLQPARTGRNSISKIVPIETVEERLEMVLRVRGEKGLNALRDQASVVATTLGWSTELSVFQRIAGALLNTQPSKVLSSSVARARAMGLPFDAGRIALFTKLFSALQQTALPERLDPAPIPPAFYTLAFFEAYFSNFIEGTEFQVDEAHRMVKTGQIVANRSADSHDIISTYKLCSNIAEIQVVPRSSEELLDILQRKHAELMHARLDKHPGQWKEYANRAGGTSFVEPELVRGTLCEGFKLYQVLREPFAKAMFMMFLISEVHPFNDGNGRLARLMMNAELASSGQCRVIITTQAREGYLDALRLLSRRSEPDLYIRMLNSAQQFTFTIPAGPYEIAKEHLEARGAFSEISSRIAW